MCSSYRTAAVVVRCVLGLYLELAKVNQRVGVAMPCTGESRRGLFCTVVISRSFRTHETLSKNMAAPYANKLGRVFSNGVSTEDSVRDTILHYHYKGLTFSEISDKTGVTKGGCHKIVSNFTKRGGTFQPAQNREQVGKITHNVLQFIEYEKNTKPSITSYEIRKKLLDRNVCTPQNVPSAGRIRNACVKKLGMTRKIVQSVPAETQTAAHENRMDAFIARASDFTPQQLHFFDEASVIRTAGNRKYGHSFKGTPAIEIQRYASNATYTVNLACGYFGVDYYDILNGPSNAMELVNFFDEYMQQTNELGNPVLSYGDCVIMDNCGFHHHNQGERLLRNMLSTRDITLLFQPPYSPEYNAAEYLFNLMRNGLQINNDFTFDFTELSIVRSINAIPDSVLPRLLEKCGYV